MLCPNCRGAMEAVEFDGHLGRKVSIDICHSCQVFWFDKYESLQLAPLAVLQLFKMIGRAGAVKTPPEARASCPRCERRLMPVSDLQRATRFEYRSCPDRHGRLTTFFNFLREKSFIKPLSPAQLEDLRRNLKTINCSNCGAPVDLAHGTSCAHCGSPLSMLDVEQAEALIAELRSGTLPHAPSASLPLELARSRRDVVQAFDAFQRAPGWYHDVSTDGLVGAAIGAFAAWMGE